MCALFVPLFLVLFLFFSFWLLKAPDCSAAGRRGKKKKYLRKVVEMLRDTSTSLAWVNRRNWTGTEGERCRVGSPDKSADGARW